MIECEKLELKYNAIVEMLKESLDLSIKEYDKYLSETKKKNKFFMDYKKRIFNEIKKLKNKIELQNSEINSLKEKNKNLLTENLLLKKKFRELSDKFKEEKANELISKYFESKVELEIFLENSINQMIPKLKKEGVLYFRKFLKKAIKHYLVNNLNKKTNSEKLSILIASIIIKDYENLIYMLIAKKLLNNVTSYQEFLEDLLKKDFVDKDKKYFHLEFEYNIDDILSIIKKLDKSSKEYDVNDLSVNLEMEEIENELKSKEKQKYELSSKLYDLEKEENDILLEMTNADEEDKESMKLSLENIDEEKRKIKQEILVLSDKIKKLENRKMFLTPLKENKIQTKNDDENIEKYNELVAKFANLLKDLK